MENFNFSTMDLGQFAPGGLFETFETPLDHQNKTGGDFFNNILQETSIINNNQWIEDIQLSSDSMTSLFELQEIKEVKSEPISIRTSVIKSPIKKKSSPPDLGNILLDCGIENIGMYDTTSINYNAVASPSNTSEVSEMEQNQELIDELEEFFIKTEGSPTTIDEITNPDEYIVDSKPTPPASNTSISHQSILKALSSGNVLNTEEMITEEDLSNAYTTSVTTDDGQNVIIIIAPSSPKESQSPAQSPIHVPCPSPSNSSDYESSYETDPDWAPSPITTIQNAYMTETMTTKAPRKKYARSKPPTPPTGPYPTDKKERKKAQNRTAAFRYREKKKSEQDDVELEVEKLAERNVILREKLAEMETEFKYLKKLMTEAGLGKYAAAAHL